MIYELLADSVVIYHHEKLFIQPKTKAFRKFQSDFKCCK